MRIAHVAHTYLPAFGGAEAVIHHLARHQMTEHHPVVIVRWNRRRTRHAKLGYPVVPLLPTTMRHALRHDHRARWRLLIAAQVCLLQRRFRFDLWHFHNSYPDGWAMVPVLDAMGVPSVFTSHGGDLPLLAAAAGGDQRDPRRADRAREACTRFGGVVAISNTIERYYGEVGVDPARIRRIPNGVDVTRLGRRSDEDRAAARRELGVHGPVLLTVGNESVEKGVDLVPAIADALNRSATPFTWLVIGPSTEPAWATRLPDNVRLLARREPGFDDSPLVLPTDAMVTLFHAADVQVVPSRAEGLPLAVLEGMAAGLPFVSTDAPGCVDLIEHGVNGLVSALDDVEALAENIARLLAAPDERAAFGAASRLRTHDWNTVAEQYEAFYRDVIDRTGPPRPKRHGSASRV